MAGKGECMSVVRIAASPSTSSLRVDHRYVGSISCAKGEELEDHQVNCL